MPVWGSLYFQNSNSPVMEYLIMFHDYSMIIVILILLMVGYLLVNSIFASYYSIVNREGQELEMIWTIIPGVILVFIAFPSLRLLYLMEESDMFQLSIKTLGHQWFWSYEYAESNLEEFDSYMNEEGDIRLLEVDEMLLLPYDCGSRVIVSSDDVIHSWTVPSMGVKVDAIPGRLNQLMLYIKRPGMYIGQCSEICGANHSFMPISLKVISMFDFLK
uniref:Cytochrome c oxidase subunit 2 n=1 Tax=Loxosceles similis TaxID=321804 RepID=A0A4V1FUV3_LOXSM|nr:cytochrome c oxidase subunit II [Loxosceles similis]QCS26171.1 cytochrome c oxidase subunit II [Loxosceles similis]